MPCSIFDVLAKKWEIARREYDRAFDPGVAVARSMSTSRRLKWQNDARSAFSGAEFQLNTHIAECPTSQGEGRPKFNLSEVPE